MSDDGITAARAHHARVGALLDGALDLPDAAREAYIARSTDGDAALAAEVRALLQAHAQLDGFLERPTVDDPLQQELQAALADRYLLRERVASGGMATVYRADDLRHGRAVAIKVLSITSPWQGTASGRQRFLDEIGVTARLQHPNVMPLFDSGSEAGHLYYVMPFVAGETVRELVRRSGPLQIDAVLRIVRGVSAALDHAHAAGVVHRDLKPENILLRDGEPVVCDFGIALATAALDVSRHTQPGMVLGTPHYMAPEQAAGATVLDARCDVYALGAIVYELLVGDPPHVAGTSQGVLAKVRAERATAVALLRPAVPSPMSAEIDRALAKQPADRHPSAGAFAAALQATASTTATGAMRTDAARGVGARRITIGVVAVLLVAGALIATRRASTPERPRPTSRFVVTPIADAAIGRAPTITPDGSAIVYAGSAATGRLLFVRRVNELAARALSGTGEALNAWVSPDGRRIAFTTADDRLHVIGIDGRDRRTLTGAFRYTEATWLNDSILVYDGYGERGLSWIRASGGPGNRLTQLHTGRHETVHLVPVALGDGRSVVFVATRDRAGPGMQAGELSLVRVDAGATGIVEHRPLGVQASQAFGFVDGHLLFVSTDGRTLLAAPLDVDEGKLTGAPIPVLEQDGGGIARVRMASDGTLLYTRRMQPLNTPVLVDTTGAFTPVVSGPAGGFMNPRVSPDGRRLVVQVSTADGTDAWLYDITTGTPTRLTRSGAVLGPAFTSDGRQVVYASPREGHDALWTMAADGSGAASRIVDASGAFGASPARRGDVLLFQRRVNGVWSIWQAPATADEAPKPIVTGSFDALMPTLSHDGRWLAYTSSESGRHEVYLRPFPGPGAAIQVSTDGGTEPLWAADGRRLYFRGDRHMRVASISTGAAPTVTARRALFIDTFDGDMPMPHRNYDLTPDGRHFVMVAPTGDASPETIVVLNWIAELRERIANAGAR